MIKRVFYYLLVLDLILVLLHIFFGENIYIFNLDNERTIPAYYSGLKLASISFLAFLMFLLVKIKKSNLKENVVWFLLSSFFIFLSFDEISELHENLGNYFLKVFNNYNLFEQDSFMWLIFLGPIILISLFLLIYFLWYLKKKKSFIYVLLGIISFFLVLVFEFIGGLIIKSSSDFYKIIIILEEMMEKIGATLFFASFLYIFKEEFQKRYKKINKG